MNILVDPSLRAFWFALFVYGVIVFVVGLYYVLKNR